MGDKIVLLTYLDGNPEIELSEKGNDWIGLRIPYLGFDFHMKSTDFVDWIVPGRRKNGYGQTFLWVEDLVISLECWSNHIDARYGIISTSLVEFMHRRSIYVQTLGLSATEIRLISTAERTTGYTVTDIRRN